MSASSTSFALISVLVLTSQTALAADLKTSLDPAIHAAMPLTFPRN